eukprot:12414972-Karenia_brevis.AAC.1
MGLVGHILLKQYRNEVKTFVEPPNRPMPYFLSVDDLQCVSPTGRCKARRGRGRCRGRVSEAACVQLCLRCMERQDSGYN